MPASTAYHALVSAAARISDSSAIEGNEILTLAALAEFVEHNREALGDARRALSQHCKVPLRYEATYFAEHLLETESLRNLARAFGIEAKLAAQNHEVARRVEIGLDAIELANATRRGGLIVDQLVSLAIAGVGIEMIRKVRTQLDDATRRNLLINLQRQLAEREPYDAIIARDESWEAATGTDDSPAEPQPPPLLDPDECGISHEDQRAVHEFLRAFSELPDSYHRSMQDDIENGSLAYLRLLIIDTALRLASFEKGHWPTSLAALAPKFIASLPVDPFSNDSFVYRPVNDSFVLYSVGPKRTDGGGSFGPWPLVMQRQADLCLDARDYAVPCTVAD